MPVNQKSLNRIGIFWYQFTPRKLLYHLVSLNLVKFGPHWLSVFIGPPYIGPFSILSVFSKVFENLVHKHFISYSCHKRIIYDKQFGFRPSYSTYMALLNVCDKIANAFENKEFVIGMFFFLNLYKAFDCIIHDILFRKIRILWN